MLERQIHTILGNLAVYDLGHGPVTLLWPSLYADHVSLMPIATELARTRRCILIDGPGHGRSAVPERRYTLWDCGRAAEQILDELGVERVDWIGNAWGGHVGVCAAIRSPSRVHTLTVIGSPMNALSPSMRWKTRVVLALLSLGARDLVGKLIAKVMISPASSPVHREYVRSCIRDAPMGGIRQAVSSISLHREDLTPQLPRVTVPTLFVAGGDDTIWPAEAARLQAAEIPGARFETVPGAAHLVPLERPRETVAVISDFLGARTSPASESSGERAGG